MICQRSHTFFGFLLHALKRGWLLFLAAIGFVDLGAKD
jgi:hypothetical protein